MGKEFLRKTSKIVGAGLAISAVALAAHISTEREDCGSKTEFSADFQTAVCSNENIVHLELANGISQPFPGKLLGWNDKIGYGYVAIGVENGSNCFISVISREGKVFPIPYLKEVRNVHSVLSKTDGDYVRYSWSYENVLIDSELKLEEGAEPFTITSRVTGQKQKSRCRE